MHQSVAAIDVLWDLDGTLVDSEILAMRVAVSTLVGTFDLDGGERPGLADDLAQRWAGLSFQQMLERCEQKHGVLDDTARRELIISARAATLAALASVEATPGILDTLTEVAEGGGRNSVVTSSGMERVAVCLRSTGLMAAFADGHGGHRIFSAATLGLPLKPAPDVYRHAVDELGTDPATTVAVEDSVPGVRAAGGAGIGAVVGYVGGSHIAPALRGAHVAALRLAGASIVVERGVDLAPAVGRAAATLSISPPPALGREL